MIQATTPTFTLRFPDTIDLTQASNFAFTVTQNNALVIRLGADALTVEPHSVSVYLGQEDSVKLRSGRPKMQLNWTYSDGSRGAIKEVEFEVLNNQLKEVME